MRRRTQVVVGSALATIGMAALVWAGSLSQAAPERGGTPREHEEGMHGTTDAMDGPDDVNPMHGVPGGEAMRERCADMMRDGRGTEPTMGGPSA
jgi:hypothetical protein